MPPNERADLSAGPIANAVHDSTTTWYALLHPPRHLWVKCSSCAFSAINETNLLRRSGWQETATTPRKYRCGECAEASSS